jgi:hypothetical protein
MLLRHSQPSNGEERMKPDTKDSPTIAIKIPALIALDFVDLLGRLNCVSFVADDESEAVDVVSTAWELKLLWHYRLHLSGGAQTKSRDIPWTANELDAVLRASQISADIDARQRRFTELQETVVWGDKRSYAPDRGRDIAALGGLHSELAALKLTYDQHVATLLAQGTRVPSGTFDEVAQILEAVRHAAETLNEIRSTQGRLGGFSSMPYISRVYAREFVAGLPTNEGIFPIGLKLPESRNAQA